MRAREFLGEENYGETANIDWEKFRAGMTALALDQEELRGYQGVDAIVFLGLMGDPSPRSQPLDLRLQGPARVIVLNAAGVDLIGAGKISGQYLAPNIIDRRDYPDRPEFDNRTAERKAIVKDYDIAVSQKNFDPAFDAFRTDALDTLAHEARHRGFRIIYDTPEIMNKIPQDVRDKMFAPWEKGKDAPEHYMIYSVSMVPNGTNIGPDQYFKSLEEFKSWRRTYKVVEQAAKSYVMTMKVTPGGLAALRNEVDKMTPKDETIKIASGPKGAVAIGMTPVKEAPPAVIKSPAATPAPTAAAPTAAAPTAAATPKTYTVRRGDVLSRIAQQYFNGRLTDLLRANPQFTANGRNPNLIYPGDKVIIPD
jgi:LysM repeat protein